MKTLKQHIRKLNKEQFNQLRNYCFHSNSLYNCALYVVKEFYKETNKYIGFNKLYHELKTNYHYKQLPSKVAQQTLRLVEKNFKSFFHLLKLKLKGKYSQKVKEPQYHKKHDLFILILPSDQVSLRKNLLKITKNIKIPFTYPIEGKVKSCIIKPYGNNYFTIHISYEENKKELFKLNKDNYLSIDLGINNFVSSFSTVGHSFIMNGKPLKAYNQFYNKQKSKIQSELKTKNNKNWSNKLNILTINRSNWINNYFNQTVAFIIKRCLEYNIGSIVCGYNETWKQESNIGRINNRNFNSIPFYLFKQKLESKCKEYGINFILQEESYTSKCSFLDEEILEHKEIYLGSRVKRGLFKTSKNLLVNADVQAAANILKKVVPNFKLNNGIKASIVKPLMLKHCFNL